MSSRSSSNSHRNLSFPGYYCVGYVKSAHGIRGELSIGLFAAQADWLENVEELSLLKADSDQLNHFNITKVRPHKEGLIAQLEGISSRNDAETLKRAQVYIPEEALESEDGEQIFLREIEGFTIVDTQGVELGRVVGFASNGSQDLLRVARDGRPEALVPFVEDFIVEIDFDGKKLHMDLPPGLLDLDEVK